MMEAWRQLKRFGLGHCDVPTMFWNLTVLMRFLVLNIDSHYTDTIPVIFYITTLVCFVAYFHVFVVSVVWYIFWEYLETKDKIAAMITLSQGMCSAIGVAKLVYLHVYADEVKEMVDGFRTSFSLVDPQSRLYKNQLKYLRKVKRRALSIWLYLMINWMIYVFKPLFLSGKQPIEKSTLIFGLEPKDKSPKYELAYISHLTGAFFVSYVTATVSALLLTMSGCTEAQMLALSEELLHLWDDTNKDYEKSRITNQESNPLDTADESTNNSKSYIINSSIQKGLENIIKAHVRNIDQISLVENLFRGAIAIEFLLLLCSLLAELLGGLENTYQMIPFAFIQVAMDCLAGQRVLDASIEFKRAVYYCNWQNFDVKNMQMVLLMLKGSQKTMVLSAGGMAALTFECLKAVVQSVYSAYTTLKTTIGV